ncbi:MAG: 30S ribosomal protein S4 [Parcubacteria group bacterium]|nr:30S ribosomal protein S4 [Parcubacteria group bacterium]
MKKPKEKISRRIGENLFLKGERSFSQKSAMIRKPYPPGQHGQKRKRGAVSEFGRQLVEKQKLKFMYGLRDRQFKRYIKESTAAKGETGDNLLRKLEMRLDNVIYRLGFAFSRSIARQLVGHGHFTLNGKRVTLPSQEVKIGNLIKIRPASETKQMFSDIKTVLKKYKTPSWLSLDKDKLEGKIIGRPEKEEIGFSGNLSAIVEYYSR